MTGRLSVSGLGFDLVHSAPWWAPAALPPTPLDPSLATPSLHPSLPLDPQRPTRPTLICSLTFLGAMRGSRGLYGIPGASYTVFRSSSEQLNSAQLMQSCLEYKEEVGAGEVISRGGALRLQREELSHFPKLQHHPNLPTLGTGKQVRKVQSTSQGDRLHR